MSNGDTTNALTLLFTCVGRRVELLQAFRAAAGRRGITLRTIGVDSDVTAPAMSCVDVAELVPRATDGTYIARLAAIIREHNVRALIPTTDTDLIAISAHREEFAGLGCVAMIAAPDVIRICRDKTLTQVHLDRHGIDTPRTYVDADLVDPERLQYPLLIKPRAGSASHSVHKLNTPAELEYYRSKVREPIVQEFIEGREYTLDVYVGLTGEPRCVVPRMRWQVRTGEVVKGVVVKDHEIMAAGRRVAESLGRSARGLITLQCIVTRERQIRFIEINPRFGGGAPLGIAAGADYPGWLMEELLGQTPHIAFDGFQHALCMLRYDWSVFVPLGDDLVPRLAPPQRPFPKF